MLMFVCFVGIHVPTAAGIRSRDKAARKVNSKRSDRRAVCILDGLHMYELWKSIPLSLEHFLSGLTDNACSRKQIRQVQRAFFAPSAVKRYVSSSEPMP